MYPIAHRLAQLFIDACGVRTGCFTLMRGGRCSLLLAALLASACDTTRPVMQLDGAAMGTTWSVQLVDPDAALDLDSLGNDIRIAIEAVEALASTYRSDSEISQFNATPGVDWIESSPVLCRLVADAQQLAAETGGAFDITVAPLVDLWGFGPSPAREAPPDSQSIDDVRQRIGYRLIETDCTRAAVRKHHADVTIDLSSTAKGFAVDQVASLLDNADVRDYVVEIGGELRLRGRNKRGQLFSIAIEDPSKSRELPVQILRLTNTAVATSGDYRNAFTHDGRNYSHIIDPRSGLPIQHQLTAVTVVAASALQADALATALLVMGPETGYSYADTRGIAALMQVRNGSGVELLRTRAMRRLTALQP